ncbi:MAG: TonB family protein [Rhodoblastus sp.]|uniref:energy transducer TonB n=1 Tax=Rhodoblastus sp. TaxID=1962975 RepID=UPI003F9C659B
MSLSDVLHGGAEPVAGLTLPATIQPVWLRPSALCLVLALHAAVLIVVRGSPTALTPLDAIEVSLEPLGDSPEDQKKVEEIKPAAAPQPPPPPPSSPALAEQSELAAPPPQVVAPEAIPLPVPKAKPKVIVKPKLKRVVVEEEDDLPSPAQARVEARRQAEAAEAREEARERAAAAEGRRKARQARLEARRGTPGGSLPSGMSRGDYAGLLAAELRRHQFYPASAMSRGVTGSVGVAFTVGASGQVVSQSITRSSGNSALDGAARAMMSAVQAPPPPGGSFSTATSIRFHLN